MTDTDTSTTGSLVPQQTVPQAGSAAGVRVAAPATADLLAEAVLVATSGAADAPRDGQAALRADIDAAMLHRGHLAGIAPTGSGKSLAVLTAAVAASVAAGERTIVSTDSLALMAQYESKDVPAVLEAASRVHGPGAVRVEFVKGVANYVDPARVIAAAQDLTESTAISIRGLLGQLRHARRSVPVEKHRLLDLVQWGLTVYLDDGETGDRHSCPVPHTQQEWDQISAPANRADDGTRFALTSKAKLAKERAAEADIVVTNHSILAVQAALGIPVVLGSRNLGRFEHVIVDEAHTLPGHVRNQGAKKLSRSTISSAVRAAYRAAGSPSGAMLDWAELGERIAAEVERVLHEFLAHGPRTGDGQARRLTEHDQLLAGWIGPVKEWAERGRQFLAPAIRDTSSISTSLRAQAAADRLTELVEAVTALGQHRPGWARWVERGAHNPNASLAALQAASGDAGLAANVAPVNVGALLRANLWEAQGQDEPVSVTAISATLPASFPAQAGLNTQVRRYPSPFDAAYARSAVFIPLLGDADLPRVTEAGFGGKRKLDLRKHPAWAAELICELVEANRGSALVLAAKAEDGQLYADRLRRRLEPAGIRVHSQWDGGNLQQVVSEWREDVSSVLVGTRSLATGVDNAGESLTLVVIDRVPRSPSNPVDDARVDDLVERAQMDRWEADRAVYVADAALLLSQAVGRLVRAETDDGMVAVLDPRLLRRPAPYPEPTRRIYMGELGQFGTKIADLTEALDWLRARRGDG